MIIWVPHSLPYRFPILGMLGLPGSDLSCGTNQSLYLRQIPSKHTAEPSQLLAKWMKVFTINDPRPTALFIIIPLKRLFVFKSRKWLYTYHAQDFYVLAASSTFRFRVTRHIYSLVTGLYVGWDAGMWSWAAWLAEGLSVLQAKQPPVADPSGTLKQEPSGRSIQIQSQQTSVYQVYARYCHPCNLIYQLHHLRKVLLISFCRWISGRIKICPIL